MPHDLKKTRVLLAGATGMLGRALDAELRKKGADVFGVGLTRADFAHTFDLENSVECRYLFNACGPFDYVVNAAGWNGGIRWNEAFPFDIFVRNSIIGLNLLSNAAHSGVRKVVSVVASCAYPDFAYWDEDGSYADRNSAGAMYEGDFLRGRPHPSVACHGYAKRNWALASGFAKQQHDLEAVCVCPPTLIGPHDHIDPERTKVGMALIKKFADAADRGDKTVEMRGTGKPLREFMWAADAAQRVVVALEKFGVSSAPLNLPGHEVAVAQFAKMAASAAGFSGEITWGEAEQDGQHRKKLVASYWPDDYFPPLTSLEDAIQQTMTWYRGLRHETRFGVTL
jgi:GDP-L-fucose synthase